MTKDKKKIQKFVHPDEDMKTALEELREHMEIMEMKEPLEKDVPSDHWKWIMMYKSIANEAAHLAEMCLETRGKGE